LLSYQLESTHISGLDRVLGTVVTSVEFMFLSGYVAGTPRLKKKKKRKKNTRDPLSKGRQARLWISLKDK